MKAIGSMVNRAVRGGDDTVTPSDTDDDAAIWPASFVDEDAISKSSHGLQECRTQDLRHKIYEPWPRKQTGRLAVAMEVDRNKHLRVPEAQLALEMLIESKNLTSIFAVGRDLSLFARWTSMDLSPCHAGQEGRER